MVVMSTRLLRQEVLNTLAKYDGISNREIAQRVFGVSDPQSGDYFVKVYRSLRYLVNKGEVRKITGRPDLYSLTKKVKT